MWNKTFTNVSKKLRCLLYIPNNLSCHAHYFHEFFSYHCKFRIVVLQLLLPCHIRACLFYEDSLNASSNLSDASNPGNSFRFFKPRIASVLYFWRSFLSVYTVFDWLRSANLKKSQATVDMRATTTLKNFAIQISEWRALAVFPLYELLINELQLRFKTEICIFFSFHIFQLESRKSIHRIRHVQP